MPSFDPNAPSQRSLTQKLTTLGQELANLRPINVFRHQALPFEDADNADNNGSSISERSTALADRQPTPWERLVHAVDTLNENDVLAVLTGEGQFRPTLPSQSVALSKGNTLLHRAVQASPAPGEEDALLLRVVALLLSAGADVHALNDHGQTPLVLAARGERWFLVRLLLDAGADPLSCSLYGESLLSHVVGELQTDLLEDLLSKGVNPNHEVNGKPLLLALLLNMDVVIHHSAQACQTMVDMLVRHGANVNVVAPPFQNQTPLLAATMWNAPLIPYLLAAGADVHASRTICVAHDVPKLGEEGMKTLEWVSHGWTALHLAALSDGAETCEQLLAAGADANARTSEGWIPREADEILRNDHRLPPVAPGLTPLNVAQRQGSWRTLACLERHFFQRSPMLNEPLEASNLVGASRRRL